MNAMIDEPIKMYERILGMREREKKFHDKKNFNKKRII